MDEREMADVQKGLKVDDGSKQTFVYSQPGGVEVTEVFLDDVKSSQPFYPNSRT
jgi:hypothetical protein